MFQDISNRYIQPVHISGLSNQVAGSNVLGIGTNKERLEVCIV